MKTTRTVFLGTIFFGAAMIINGSAQADDKTSLPGYTEGAQVVRVEKTQGQIDAMSGVVYTQIKQLRSITQLEMSLLVPRSDDLKPAIIYFPGGGFTSAEHEKYIDLRMALAKAGFVVAAAQYRTVPNKFPALVQDGKAAVRYLREHASEYGIDPTRIGVLGDSAGGYVSQMLGMTNGETAFDAGQFLDKSSDVQAVVTLYGLSNLLDIGDGFPEPIAKVHESPAVTETLLVNGPAFADFAGASITSDPKKALQASPMGHVEGSKPPFLIMHGTADTLVSPKQSAQLYKALKNKGSKVDYLLVEGAAHGDITWYQPPIIDRVVNWYKDVLGSPLKGKSDASGSKSGKL
ncbi:MULTISPECIES: alpha/beta hydrolase [Agrobacterium]|uniref:Alpha/beta hydrolase n=2 Tax=Agrobacterium rosae TaxID=1972867 RepID=A0A1R3U730_9HYPH|nr:MULTISPECIES: alpha/beta hydrolase [Agrobacterium]MDX8304606.1 alpha/beta hydrolase [Agrobacterium rosae]MDX8315132.1 alpha/beta hydrolase [Agrobacterium rosae]MDX8330850.1 alpha/beta hydrolase [Agrobacterium rosae]SCX26217.1 Carboxylesterase NlhH [Agrobacterium sp. DSM 25558]SCX32720.1 Carboxylesterase NlhH [Agrobacterium rosae]